MPRQSAAASRRSFTCARAHLARSWVFSVRFRTCGPTSTNCVIEAIGSSMLLCQPFTDVARQTTAFVPVEVIFIRHGGCQQRGPATMSPTVTLRC